MQVARRVLASLLRLLILAVGSHQTKADLIITPMGLKPGASFQLAFITDGVYQATSSDINTYNQIVQGVAAGVGLTEVDGQQISWTAIVSTAATNATTNAPQLAPIYNANAPNPSLIAATGTLYSSTVNNPIQYDDHGSQYFGLVWTGSTPHGLASANPLGSLFPTYGISFSNSTGPPYQWLDFGGSYPKSAYLPLYALSTRIVVPGVAVPEPSTTLTFSLGALALIAYRRRRSIASQA